MTTQNIDRDAIDSNATLVREYEGAKLFRIGILDMVVLNGTHKQMGRQYGGLVKDNILAKPQEILALIMKDVEIYKNTIH